MRIVGILLIFLTLTGFPTFADESVTITYPPPLSANDTRFDYHLTLLRMALERTESEYGPFELKPGTVKMNQLRQFQLLQAGDPSLDIAIKPFSNRREQHLTPVRIPLEKGMLGWRIMLIHRKTRNVVANISSIDDLKRFRIGQGLGWKDVDILRYNGLVVVEGPTYEGLFRMLLSQRFQLFPRGAGEAFDEWEERHEDLPYLHVDTNLLLHYPFARYFWTGNSDKGRRLNERITKGLESLIADGTFDSLFTERYGAIIKRAKMHERIIIELENPDMPPSTPLDRKELWFDPLAE